MSIFYEEKGVSLFGCKLGHKDYDFILLFPDGTARHESRADSYEKFEKKNLCRVSDRKNLLYWGFRYAGSWERSESEIIITVTEKDHGNAKCYKGTMVFINGHVYELKLDVEPTNPKRSFSGKKFYLLGWLSEENYIREASGVPEMEEGK